jgi:hypothetical protein
VAEEMCMGPGLELDMDFDDLVVLLAESNPVRAINEFVGMNPELRLDNPHLEKLITPLGNCTVRAIHRVSTFDTGRAGTHGAGR